MQTETLIFRDFQVEANEFGTRLDYVKYYVYERMWFAVFLSGFLFRNPDIINLVSCDSSMENDLNNNSMQGKKTCQKHTCIQTNTRIAYQRATLLTFRMRRHWSVGVVVTAVDQIHLKP